MKKLTKTTMMRFYWFRILAMMTILSTSCAYAADDPIMFVPEPRNYSWSQVSFEDLRCPTFLIGPDEVKGTSVSVGVMRSLVGTSDLGGYICSKEQLATTCKTNAVGQHWISHDRHKTKLTQRQCKAAVMVWMEEGTSPIAEYPAPSCAFKWFRTYSETSVASYVSVTQHPVHVDLYTATLVDPGFVGGVCSGTYCPMIHDSMLWMGLKRIKSKCPAYRTITGIKQDDVIYTDDYPPFSLVGACSMSFCETEGIRTREGLFLIADLTYPACPNSSPVKAATLQFEIDHISEEFHEMSARAMCLNAYGVIRRTQAVHDLQLSYFGQNHPGEGVAYRRGIGPDGKGLLLQAHVSYIPIMKVSDPLTEVIGWTKEEGVVKWTYWLFVENDTWAGPNGWTKRTVREESLVTIPHLEMFKREYDQRILERQDLTTLIHPHVENLGDSSILSGADWDPESYHDLSSTQELADWFMSPIKATLTVIGLIAVLTLGLYLFFKWKKKKSSKAPKATSRLPREANSWV